MPLKPSLFQSLISHQWKESLRSAYWEKSLLLRIFIGIMVLYLAVNLVVLGLFMGKIVDSAFPDDAAVRAFSLILFYYFIADFILRFFLQPLPVLSILPYLHLPVKRSSLFNFLLIKSALNLFNFLPLLILIPFMIRSVMPDSTALYALTWLAAVVLLLFTNNYLVFLAKKVFVLKPVILYIIIAVAGLLIFADIKSGYTISGMFANTILTIARHPYLLILPLLSLLAMYSAAWYILYLNRYIEMDVKKDRLLFSGKGSSLFETFGITGQIILLEIKLILRNNRPRSYLMMSLMFLLYGLIVYPPHTHVVGSGMFLLIGLLITGIIMIQHGQLILAWESSNFDKICTSGLRMEDYFRGKYWFFFSANCLSFLLTLPYGFYGYRIALINIAAFLYNAGINSFIILLLGTYNTRRIDLNKGAFFNYEGANFIHFLLIIPLFGLPFLVYLPFAMTGNPNIGLLVLGLTGLAGLLLSGFFIRLIVKQFNSRKYKILSGFRTT